MIRRLFKSIKHFGALSVSALPFLPAVGGISIAIAQEETSLGISEKVSNFYDWALGIGGLLALGIIVYGGILYSTSSGNPSRITEAKRWMYSAVTGLLLLFGAFIILNTINPNLVGLKSIIPDKNDPQPPPIYEPLPYVPPPEDTTGPTETPPEDGAPPEDTPPEDLPPPTEPPTAVAGVSFMKTLTTDELIGEDGWTFKSASALSGGKVFESSVFSGGNRESSYRFVASWGFSGKARVQYVATKGDQTKNAVAEFNVSPVHISVPSGAIRVTSSQMANLQSLVDQNKSSPTTFVLPAGKYREFMVHAGNGDTFMAEPGTTVILSGSRDISNSFSKEGSLWVSSQSHYNWGFLNGESSISDSEEWGRCANESSSACRFPELLFFNGSPLKRVENKSEVGSGKWYFDYGANKVYVGSDPSGKTVELAIKPYAIFGDGGEDNVTIAGLIVEQYATPIRQGTLQSRSGRVTSTGKNWRFIGNEVRWSHGKGIQADAGGKVIGNYVHHNSQLGIASSYARSPSVELSNNEIAYNCAGASDIGARCHNWEGGGVKLDQNDNSLIQNNYVHHNNGMGILVDHNSNGGTMVGNVSVSNVLVGLQFELSAGHMTIKENTSIGNGEDGVRVLVANNADVINNHISGNNKGIIISQDSRCPNDSFGNCTKNVLVKDNYIESTAEYSGADQWGGSPDLRSGQNNRFESNEYKNNCNGQPFKWNSRMSWDSWRNSGQDSGGKFENPSC